NNDMGLLAFLGGRSKLVAACPQYKTAFDQYHRQSMPRFEVGNEYVPESKPDIELLPEQSAGASTNWLRHVVNTDAPTDVDSISETVDAVFVVVSNGGPESVDLRNLPVGE